MTSAKTAWSKYQAELKFNSDKRYKERNEQKAREKVRLLEVEAKAREEVKGEIEKMKIEKAKANDMKKQAESKLEEARKLLKESGKLDKKASKLEEVINTKKRKAESKSLLHFFKKRPKVN